MFKNVRCPSIGLATSPKARPLFFHSVSHCPLSDLFFSLIIRSKDIMHSLQFTVESGRREGTKASADCPLPLTPTPARCRLSGLTEPLSMTSRSTRETGILIHPRRKYRRKRLRYRDTAEVEETKTRGKLR